MRIFGLDIQRTKAAVGPADLSAFDSRLNDRGWMTVHEPNTGFWQRNMEMRSPSALTAFSAVYAAVSRIALDISKMRVKLVAQDSNGIWSEIDNAAFSPVLRKPNRYQTRIQFWSEWVTSKLTWGNTYVYKERDSRNVVIALYVLNPARVTPRVATDGSVWYELRSDYLAQTQDAIVPADDIIHDRGLTPWHPLWGISPIQACGSSAAQGARIQSESERFFANASRPGAVVSPKDSNQTITDDQLRQIKERLEESSTGRNAGRALLFRSAMNYQQMTIPAADAQLIEQLKWTVEDVARCFHVPPHKLGLGNPTFNNIASLDQAYYGEALQPLVEAIEVLMDEGLGLGAPYNRYGTEFDLSTLLRMDLVTQMEVAGNSVKNMVATVNEARSCVNLPPVTGGDKVLTQEQYWPIDMLADRPPPGSQPSVAPPSQQANPEPAPAEPAPNKAFAEPETLDFDDRIVRLLLNDCIERARVGGVVA